MHAPDLFNFVPKCIYLLREETKYTKCFAVFECTNFPNYFGTKKIENESVKNSFLNFKYMHVHFTRFTLYTEFLLRTQNC